MLLIILFFVSLFFLMGTFCLTALGSAFRNIHRKDSKKQLIALGKWFLYRPFHLFFFRNHEFEGIYFATLCAQSTSRFFFAASSIFFLLNTPLFVGGAPVNSFWIIFSVILLILITLILGDYLPRLFGVRLPERAIRVCAPFASLFMFLNFPLIYIFTKVAQSLSRTVFFESLQEPQAQAKQEIIDIVQQAELSPELDTHDKKLIHSVLTFRELIAREVMVPRVDMFALSADTSIRDAGRLLEEEGYSRTPVYRNTVDNIVGVLMYKDILSCYLEYESKGNNSKILDAPIETLVKGVLYTPETKKLSLLLQEFRKKQVHLAIVVDEYGGTEGIVTIEDILEEIVGDIADEYDEEAALYVPLPDGSWIVDPRMSILDAEEQLGIEFPQEGDYDTIGGYIFHCAGSIPSRGFVIHNNQFEIEILRSSERSVEKVKIRPIRPNTTSEQD